MTNEAQVYIVLYKIFGIYALCLTIVGTLFNLASFYVCHRIKNNSTFMIITFLTLTDALTLYYWNLNNFLINFTSVSLLTTNIWICKFGNFLQFASLQTSAWLLVAICWDRFFSIYFKHWKTIYFKKPRPLILSVGVIVTICLINLNIFFTFGYDITANNITSSFCFELQTVPSTKWMTTWGKVHLALYSIIPFIMIAIANILLILTIYQRRKKVFSNHTQTTKIGNSQSNDAKKSRNEKMNQTVLTMTFFFIALTSPIACASFFYDSLFTTDYGNFIIEFLDCISFSYHGLNFVIMTFSNTMFRSEFFKILRNAT